MYDDWGQNPYFSERISINVDSTFTYFGGSHLGKKKADGHWRVSNDTMILHSEYFPSKNGRVEESTIAEQNYSYFRFLSLFFDKPLIKMPILVNDTLKLETDSSGEIKTNFHINNLHVDRGNGYGLHYAVKDASSNHFVVYFDPIENSKIFLINWKYIITKKGLVDTAGYLLKKRK